MSEITVDPHQPLPNGLLVTDEKPTQNADLQGKNTSTETNDPLAEPGARKALARRIKADIDAYCADVYDDGHRTHLGASLIGHECSRYLWYIFRWVKHVKHTGRQQRLFNRGHREEERFVEWLRGIGFTVSEYKSDVLHYHAESDSIFFGAEFDPGDGLVEDMTGNPIYEDIAKKRGVTREQHRVSGVSGHFGGSQDGQSTLPERYGIPGKFLLEFKTNGTGKGFTAVEEKGVALAKPQHYAQMSTYGYLDDFDYCIYIIINKNDDSITVEVVKLDKRLGEQCEKKARDVITAQVPPAKLSVNPTFFKCKWCDFKEICHGEEKVEINCRSCTHAIAVENGNWQCNLVAQIIPKDFIPQGCDKHTPIG